MGKVSAAAAATPPTAEMKRRKKKNKKNNKTQFPNNSNINKALPTSSNYNSTPRSEEDDEDDERREKKVKLVVRLPRGVKEYSEEEEDDEDLGGEDKIDKKRKINEVHDRSGDGDSDQEEKVSKVTDVIHHASELEPGPTTPLPDKKLLVFILDRLQKKDTYGVFSEPVDPNELQDYHEIVKHPMDFGTVRKKLNGKAYKSLEDLEADILLICANAMLYNAQDTVYYRQARSIQEIARRDFANLRHEGDDGEPQPKIVRRGRPPGKTQKKHLEKSPVDRIGPEISSDVTLASMEEKGTGPNSSYSLRKTSSLYRSYRSPDGFYTPNRPSIGENGSDWSIDWNNEFPASILRADMKHGNKNITVDVTKRDSYRDYHPPGSDSDPSGFLNIDGDMKRLMPVGLNYTQHAYARSLAKFAANLGPVAWQVASKRIESILPAGVKFGPGWVGETESLPEVLSSVSGEKQKSSSHLSSDIRSNALDTSPSTPGANPAPHQSKPSEQMIEAVRLLNSQNELPVQSGAPAWGIQGWPHQALQKSMFHPSRNGFTGAYGQSSSQLGISSPSVATGQSGQQEGLPPYQRPGVIRRNDASSSSSVYPPDSYNNLGTQESKPSHSSNMLVQGKVLDSITEPEASHTGRSAYDDLPAEQKPSLPIPPDLNVRVAGSSSPSSSLVAGSPQQQPDLALQL